MSDKKELYEVLFEEINHKMDLVLEGYGEMGRKFEEAGIERQQIKEELTHKIGFVANDLKETKAELRSELQETREELGQKIDKISEVIEDHEVRIETLEEKVNTG